MKAHASAFGAGALFAVGLAISGMTKPSKVVGFLDLFGAWDPSLAFVMMGAVAVHVVAYGLARRRTVPLFAPRFQLPTRSDIDVPLVAGAAVFGVGWGLGGFCPGPGIVAAGSGSMGGVVFLLGMTLGMLVESGVVHASPRATTGGSR